MHVIVYVRVCVFAGACVHAASVNALAGSDVPFLRLKNAHHWVVAKWVRVLGVPRV